MFFVIFFELQQLLWPLIKDCIVQYLWKPPDVAISKDNFIRLQVKILIWKKKSTKINTVLSIHSCFVYIATI